MPVQHLLAVLVAACVLVVLGGIAMAVLRVMRTAEAEAARPDSVPRVRNAFDQCRAQTLIAACT